MEREAHIALTSPKSGLASYCNYGNMDSKPSSVWCSMNSITGVLVCLCCVLTCCKQPVLQNPHCSPSLPPGLLWAYWLVPFSNTAREPMALEPEPWREQGRWAAVCVRQRLWLLSGSRPWGRTRKRAWPDNQPTLFLQSLLLSERQREQELLLPNSLALTAGTVPSTWVAGSLWPEPSSFKGLCEQEVEPWSAELCSTVQVSQLEL